MRQTHPARAGQGWPQASRRRSCHRFRRSCPHAQAARSSSGQRRSFRENIMAISSVSYTKTPQAGDDSYWYTEDELLAASNYDSSNNVHPERDEQ
jgi:hypothetical protein